MLRQWIDDLILHILYSVTFFESTSSLRELRH